MSVKSDVLMKLEKNRGNFFSGEELANELSVTRSAVWKSVTTLKKEGYQILGVSNKGYSLMPDTDVLSEEVIRIGLFDVYQKIPIRILKETDSTNKDAKQAAVSGAEHGSVFVAEKQNSGRGRRGRTFVSLPGSSIYMSVVLKPKLDMVDAVFLTTAASVAVYRAVKSVTGKETLIKWVNDLHYKGKKVCGILTEAVTDCETGMVDSIILGIGINFKVPEKEIPLNLQDIVGALYSESEDFVSRNQLISEILNEVFTLCEALPDRSFMKEYKEHSMIIGSDIWVINAMEQRAAAAVDIDDNGGLVVKYEDGTMQTLNTGEVSIRKRDKF